MSEAAPPASPSEALPAPAARPRSGPRRGPPPTAPRPAPSAPPRPAPRSRWTDTLTALLLCVAAGGVIVAAAPSVLRAAGLGAPARDDGELRNGGRLSLPQPPVGVPAHPIFSHGEDDDEDEPPRGPYATLPPEGLRPPPPEGDVRGGKASGKRATPGVARRPIRLFDKPGPGGTVVGEVRAGDLVMIGKEAGEWMLVAHDGDDGVVMGWTKKSEIAAR